LKDSDHHYFAALFQDGSKKAGVWNPGVSKLTEQTIQKEIIKTVSGQKFLQYIAWPVFKNIIFSRYAKLPDKKYNGRK
jgi:hypothetical protein